MSKKAGTLSRDTGFHKIDSGAYKGINKDIPTVVTASELIINKDVSEDVAYEITKILCENIEELHRDLPPTRTFIPEKAWMAVAVPLHPGAVKYYKEKGYMK